MGKINGAIGKQKKPERERVARTSESLLAEQVEKLKELFPEATSEDKVDFDKLKATLGEFADDRPERYSFTWAGKRDCIKLLQVPSRATLIPCLDESIDWDTNVIAEVAPKEAGFGLNCRVEEVNRQDRQEDAEKENGACTRVFRVTDEEKEQFFYVCLGDKVRLDDLKPLSLTRDMLFVCRDVALDDETAANLALQCRLWTI